MEAKYFNKLITSLKLENDPDCIAFSAKYQNYELSFYADENNNLTVHNFGFTKRHNWVKLEPTKMQLAKLRFKIDQQLEILNNKPNAHEYDRDFKGDHYDYFGVKQSDFI